MMIKIKEGFNGERALVLPRSVVKEMEDDPMSAILYMTDIGYYPHAVHHFRERREPISQYVFIYCTDGAGWYEVEGVRYRVTANQFFILPAGIPHKYSADEKNPWTIYWIHFKGSFAPMLAPDKRQPVDIPQSDDSRIRDRVDMFEEIMRTLEMGYSHENLLYACSTLYHFLHTLRYIRQYRNAVDNSGNDDGNVVTHAIHFMKENIDKKMTLDEIANHAGYSRAYFAVLFKQRTGYSPVSYLNQLKIQKACQLIDFSNMKLNTICFKVGIDDVHYLSRLFRKIMGMSPTDYKQLKKG